MSINREDFGVTLEIHSGTTKEFELTVIDPDTGVAKDLSDTDVYATGIVKIYKPGGTQIGANMGVSYDTPRTTGIIFFTITSTHSNIINAGNWIGNVEFLNTDGVKIDQQFFNINILESY